MRTPIGWLRDYVDLPSDTATIVDRLAMLGFPVEGIERRPSLSGVVVGRIARLEPHPNADRLQVCAIDVGAARQLTIATAATNVAEGQIVPVATIGARLVRDGEPLVIEPRKMRGLESQGMLCSADELGFEPALFEDGILQLDDSLPLGADVVELFRLTDDVIEIETTANRVDAMSVVGIARELGAAFGTSVREPVTLTAVRTVSPSDATIGDLRLTIESPDCRRFVAQRFSDVHIGLSPAWIRFRLALAGQRPIDNVVDISNFVMLELGQPQHVYDFTHLAGHHIVVRDAKPGERMQTLDGEEHTLEPRALVIADDAAAQGLAGLMGSAASEVAPETTEVVVESATFSGPRVRRMALALGMRTEASSRHERGLPLDLADLGAARAAVLFEAGGAKPHEAFAVGLESGARAPIAVDVAKIGALIGIALSTDEAERALCSLGFSVMAVSDKSAGSGGSAASAVSADKNQQFLVTPPYWRNDIAIPADVAEEVARIVGYDRIEASSPPVFEQGISSAEYLHERRLAHALATAGYREAVSLSMQPANVSERFVAAGVSLPGAPVEVMNPRTEDQRFMRFSLIPGLLSIASRYQASAPLRLFELGRIFERTASDPFEVTMGAWIYVAERSDDPGWRDSGFSTFKGEALAFVREMTGRDADALSSEAPPAGLHPGKSAALVIGGKDVAAIGAVDPRLLAAYEIERPVYLGLLRAPDMPEYRIPRYRAPSKYPSVERDIALVLEPEIPAHEIEHAIRVAVDGVVSGTQVFDEYRGPQIGEGRKSLAVRITFQREDATLTDEEVEAHMRAILALLRDRFGARIRE